MVPLCCGERKLGLSQQLANRKQTVTTSPPRHHMIGSGVALETQTAATNSTASTHRSILTTQDHDDVLVHEPSAVSDEWDGDGNLEGRDGQDHKFTVTYAFSPQALPCPISTNLVFGPFNDLSVETRKQGRDRLVEKGGPQRDIHVTALSQAVEARCSSAGCIRTSDSDTRPCTGSCTCSGTCTCACTWIDICTRSCACICISRPCVVHISFVLAGGRRGFGHWLCVMGAWCLCHTEREAGMSVSVAREGGLQRAQQCADTAMRPQGRAALRYAHFTHDKDTWHWP